MSSYHSSARRNVSSAFKKALSAVRSDAEESRHEKNNEKVSRNRLKNTVNEERRSSYNPDARQAYYNPEARRASYIASRQPFPAWTLLNVDRIPGYTKIEQEWGWDQPCPYCECVYLKSASVSFRKKCCKDGAFNMLIPHLEPLLPSLQHVISDDDSLEEFSSSSSSYNNILSLGKKLLPIENFNTYRYNHDSFHIYDGRCHWS
jgi:hypothetical protein